jgi:hypothetical protein
METFDLTGSLLASFLFTSQTKVLEVDYLSQNETQATFLNSDYSYFFKQDLPTGLFI